MVIIRYTVKKCLSWELIILTKSKEDNNDKRNYKEPTKTRVYKKI